MTNSSVAVVGDHQNSLALAEATAPRGPESQPTNSDLTAEPPQRSCQVAISHRDFFPQAAVTPRYQPMIGPLSPRPNLTLVEAVAGKCAS